MTEAPKTNEELLNAFDKAARTHEAAGTRNRVQADADLVDTRIAVIARMVQPTLRTPDGQKLGFVATIDLGNGRSESRVVELTAYQVMDAAKHIPVEYWPNVPLKHTLVEGEAREVARLAAVLLPTIVNMPVSLVGKGEIGAIAVSNARVLLTEARKQVAESAI